MALYKIYLTLALVFILLSYICWAFDLGTDVMAYRVYYNTGENKGYHTIVKTGAFNPEDIKEDWVFKSTDIIFIEKMNYNEYKKTFNE